MRYGRFPAKKGGRINAGNSLLYRVTFGSAETIVSRLRTAAVTATLPLRRPATTIGSLFLSLAIATL